jgi:hypothetical protein
MESLLKRIDSGGYAWHLRGFKRMLHQYTGKSTLLQNWQLDAPRSIINHRFVSKVKR